MRSQFHLKSRLLAIALATASIGGGGTLTAIGLGAVAPALAQDQPNGGAPAGPHGGNRMGKILMSLNLTDAQKTQIRSIMADTRKQNQNVTDREQRRANFKAAYAKIDDVLTPAQRTQFHAKMDAMHQQNEPAHTQ
jgi:Spy/CpxP family protein refolding chaperone